VPGRRQCFTARARATPVRRIDHHDLAVLRARTARGMLGAVITLPFDTWFAPTHSRYCVRRRRHRRHQRSRRDSTRSRALVSCEPAPVARASAHHRRARMSAPWWEMGLPK
jgi:hypothetical protein